MTRYRPIHGRTVFFAKETMSQEEIMEYFEPIEEPQGTPKYCHGVVCGFTRPQEIEKLKIPEISLFRQRAGFSEGIELLTIQTAQKVNEILNSMRKSEALKGER